VAMKRLFTYNSCSCNRYVKTMDGGKLRRQEEGQWNTEIKEFVE